MRYPGVYSINNIDIKLIDLIELSGRLKKGFFLLEKVNNIQISKNKLIDVSSLCGFKEVKKYRNVRKYRY